MAGLLTYWHTVRHLRPVQVYGRIAFKLATPHVDLCAAPPLRPRSRTASAPASRARRMVGPSEFVFLNERRKLPAAGWDVAGSRLWRYSLHYFDDLNAAAASDRTEWHRQLLARWVRENPPGTGTGWEPYPTSLRMANWIKWAAAGNALPSECVHSLAVQARWLGRRIESHLLGNHLLSNAKALVLAGLFFSGPEADGWLERGMNLLDRELDEQIMKDGGHFERSPMYHALLLEDLLDVLNVAAVFPDMVCARLRSLVARCGELVPRMLTWLYAMCHPDGEIAFFGDSAMGIAPTTKEVADYAERLGCPRGEAPSPGITTLDATGYARMESQDAVAVLDVGEVGPDYLPAHAHADTLSFEMSLFGQRVFVNSGTSTYEWGPARTRERGTPAHNTVVVDGMDSSEVWGSFRVGRRARPCALSVGEGRRKFVQCSHDGYSRALRPRVHTRRWEMDGGSLVLEDTVTGRFDRAAAMFHVHPAMRTILEENPDGTIGATLVLPEGRRVRLSVEGGALSSVPDSWHPEFGLSVPNVCLVATFSAATLRTRIAWDVAA